MVSWGTEAFGDQAAVQILCLGKNLSNEELAAIAMVEDELGCRFLQVHNLTEFEAAVRAHTFDLIISDLSLPVEEGMAALNAVLQLRPQEAFRFLYLSFRAENVFASDAVMLQKRLSRHLTGPLGNSIKRILAGKKSGASGGEKRAPEKLMADC